MASFGLLTVLVQSSKSSRSEFFQGNGPLDPIYLPKRVDLCPDDPYRSLVAEVIIAGAINKTLVPFAEFMWAKFYRDNMPILKNNLTACHPNMVTPEKLMGMPWCCVRPASQLCFPDVNHTGLQPYMAAAEVLAHDPRAKHLPGYIPPNALLR